LRARLLFRWTEVQLPLLKQGAPTLKPVARQRLLPWLIARTRIRPCRDTTEPGR